MSIVSALAPNIPTTSIRQTMNREWWFKVINGKLHVPVDNVLRSNFLLIDQLQEALRSFEAGAPQRGWWDDSKVNGYTCVSAEDVLKRIKEHLWSAKVLACDIETRDTGYDGNKVLLIGFAYGDYDSIVIPAEYLNNAEVYRSVQLLFNREDIVFIWQNGKFDTTRLYYLTGLQARVDEDTMLLHYACINERKGTHDLKGLGELYLQTPAWDDELDAYKKKWCAQHKVKIKEFKYDMIPMSILIPYLYRDCCTTFQLFERLKALARPGSYDNYRRLIKASNVFKDIELNGCLVDMDYQYELDDQLDTLIVEAERHVRTEAARTWDPRQYAIDTGAKTATTVFNYKSPKQLKWMLEQVTGKRLQSANKDVLEALINEYPDRPFIQAIAELRKYTKYMDTYVQGIQKIICPDGRVRCTFKLHGTETGRLSCADPNMQNIPRDKLIKNVFMAPDGYVLIQLDYSQAELRVLAYLSQDEYLRETYREGKDLHDAMALRIFGEGFTKEQRVAAKTVNFGIPYGRGPGSMAAKMHMSISAAAQTIRDWFKAAPGAKAFVDEMRKIPHGEETYTTVFGRQRNYIVTYENANHCENEAVNFPISSVASDLTMLSVCEIYDKIKDEGIDARIVNTVHDSIVIECIDDPEAIARVVEIGTWTMSDMPKRYLLDPVLDFPFVADAEVGHTWGNLKSADEYLGR